MIEEEKQKEKIETKGAYSHDLHEAIRDVRRAFATGNRSGIGSRLNALYDICAPEIRESINQEWIKIDEQYSGQLEFYHNAKFETTDRKEDSGWNNCRDDEYSDTDTFRIYVDYFTTGDARKQIAINTRESFLSEIWDKIYHERFRACIDCLDEHGELRKWREVDYGKL